VTAAASSPLLRLYDEKMMTEILDIPEYGEL
jgi:hypothetical protein